MEDKILVLAKKLKELADKGVDGEKTTAVQMLKKLMVKHNITEEMLLEDITKEREFKIKENQIIFLKQIIASVVGRNYRTQYLKVNKTRKIKTYFFDLTDSDYIEIEAKFNFYWTAWEKDLDLFYKAFVQKNHLYTKETGTSHKEEKELTQQEKADLWKMMNMMNGLDKHKFQKQLSA